MDGADSTINDMEDVRAGLQGNVRLIIFHSSLVFLTPSLTKSLSNQVNENNFECAKISSKLCVPILVLF